VDEIICDLAEQKKKLINAVLSDENGDDEVRNKNKQHDYDINMNKIDIGSIVKRVLENSSLIL
jgi:hypothetical protein